MQFLCHELREGAKRFFSSRCLLLAGQSVLLPHPSLRVMCNCSCTASCRQHNDRFWFDDANRHTKLVNFAHAKLAACFLCSSDNRIDNNNNDDAENVVNQIQSAPELDQAKLSKLAARSPRGHLGI